MSGQHWKDISGDCIVLYCIVLCYVMLCYVMVCYVVLCCVVLCYSRHNETDVNYSFK